MDTLNEESELGFTLREQERELVLLRDREGKLWAALVAACIVVGMFLVHNFEREYILVGDPSSGSTDLEVYAIRSRWWGLTKKSTPIRWTTPTTDLERGIEFKDWCYEPASGEWVPYFDWQ